MPTPYDNRMPFDAAVALGLVPGWSVVRIFGDNNDIDAGTEDVWGAGGIMTWPTAAGAVTLVSTDNTKDVAAGTGARIVVVEGLDANYNPLTEYFAMNGTTNVVGVQLFLRVQRIYATVVGTDGANAGTITATHGGNTQATIGIGLGASSRSHYTVPRGQSLYITLYEVSSGRQVTADLQINAFVREFDANSTNNYASWRMISSVDMSEGTVVQVAPRGRTISALSDIRIQGVSSGANCAASVAIGAFLIDNSVLIQSR